jgi:hypothetical protein
MTRDKFIKKWLGNMDYSYTEQNRDLMRDDLDKVISYHTKDKDKNSTPSNLFVSNLAIQKLYSNHDIEYCDCGNILDDNSENGYCFDCVMRACTPGNY